MSAYIHKNYYFIKYSTPVQSNIWECLIIKICNHLNEDKNLYICNIYRPPKDSLTIDILNRFTDELNQVLSDFNKSKALTVLVGDFNIDLLKLRDRSVIKDYFNNMLI